ncbi:MAG: sigma-70 family RNA polymerase sigma factor [Pyrinomonadaceae bacterium]|nr:sigma-70 family RNA polymerase sigma factor [Pyrinomonadaceae bacterium]
MLTDKSDEQLVKLAVNEDPEAFGEIVKRWERKIYALCYGMLNREDEAKDAAQEAFIAAYKNLSKFRGEAKVSSWLHRIAVNQCLTRKRREKTRSESFFDESESSEEKVFVAPARLTPARQTEQGERIAAVRAAVSALPPELKQIVVMKEFEEMTFQEISDVMEIPLSTVKSRLYTALKQLRMKLERTPLEVV